MISARDSAPTGSPLDVVYFMTTALFRHRKKAIMVALLTLVLGVGLIFSSSRKYESVSKLFVRVGRETVALDPTAVSSTQMLHISDARSHEINSVLAMLQSRLLHETAVDEIGSEPILNGRMGESTPGFKPLGFLKPLKSSVKSAGVAVGLIDEVDNRELAIQLLQDSYGVSLDENSSVVTIRGESKSPEMAQRITESLVDAYREQHMKANMTAGSYEFFRDQQETIELELVAASEKLRSLKDASGLVSLEGQQQSLEAQLLAIESDLIQSRALSAATSARIDAIRAQMKELPDRVLADETTGHDNTAADYMRQQLFSLELRYEESVANRGKDSAGTKTLFNQVEAARRMYVEQSKPRAQKTTAQNSVYVQLDQELTRELANQKGAEARIEELQRLVTVYGQKQVELNKNGVILAKMTREVAQLEDNYRTYSSNLENARIDRALKNERITNINVFQPASLITKPIGTSRLILLVLALVASAFAGIMAAFGIEYVDASVRSIDDVESQLDLPVLVTIPRTSKHEVRV